MNPFQKKIQAWLSRATPNYSRNRCFDIPLVLSSDIGLTRIENQDRAAALYTGANSINPLLAIAVADGMGGMRDGGRCSTVALSSFFQALIQHRSLSAKERAHEAIRAANNQVFEMYGGDGGATLTAVLLDHHGKKLIVHIGDTRVYTFGPKKRTQRHTTDDSLFEAVGGTGRELLQFIGMGDSMQPSISDFPCSDGFCAITTDGIHGIEEKTLYKILEHSTDIDQASERLNSISMWCGGSDNATSAIFNIDELFQSIDRYEGSGIQLWDVGGDLTTLWLRDEELAKNALTAPTVNEPATTPHLAPSAKSLVADEHKKKNKRIKNEPKAERASNYHEEIQLDIEIGNPNEQGEVGVDSE